MNSLLSDKFSGSALLTSPEMSALSSETLSLTGRTRLDLLNELSEELAPVVSDLDQFQELSRWLTQKYPELDVEPYVVKAKGKASRLLSQRLNKYSLPDYVSKKTTQSYSEAYEYLFRSLSKPLKRSSTALLSEASPVLAQLEKNAQNASKRVYATAQQWVMATYGEVVESVVAAGLQAAGSSAHSSTGILPEGSTTRQSNTTGITYENVAVYIEGVQVPFVAISVGSTMGTYPTASIEIPPQAGLMDIARYYRPKVHIFYEDKNFGGQRLLFSGHIVAPNFTRSRSGGMATISFHCMHKAMNLQGLTLEYGGILTHASPSLRDANPQQAALKVGDFNSVNSLIRALVGITGIQSGGDDAITPSNPKILAANTSLVDPKFGKYIKRYEGMPSVLINFWNQLKVMSYANEVHNKIMSKMYIPLFEEGLHFFNRMSGHHILETMIQNTRIGYCPEKTNPEAVEHNILVAPPFRLNNFSAINAQLLVTNLHNMMNYSGEMMPFLDLIDQFYFGVDYHILHLNSPAQVPIDPSIFVDPDVPGSSQGQEVMAIDYVVKPVLPFYYSPICNVLLPKMYSTISIGQDETGIPTRITALHNFLMSSDGTLNSSHRAPASIREAVAVGIAASNAQSATQISVNLANTTNGSYQIPGKYEQGSGIRPQQMALPQWLAFMVKAKTDEASNTLKESWPEVGTDEYKRLMDLSAAWVYRYGYNHNPDTAQTTRKPWADVLNPYSPKSAINPSQRVLFAAADYYFTQSVVQSRSGSVEAVFNPYIIPGYPMDVVSDSPNEPSFHGLCSSVTHSITSRSVVTSVSMVAASTFAELTNYYIPPAHPWLSTAMNLVNMEFTEGDEPFEVGEVTSSKTTIINNPRAKAYADTFYKQVLGVGAAAIEDIYDFTSGLPSPVLRQGGVFVPGSTDKLPQPNGGEGNPFMSVMGNLTLVSRPIESRGHIEAQNGVMFIDLTPALYNGTQMQYSPPILGDERLLEPGASMFLDYEETEDFVK